MDWPTPRHLRAYAGRPDEQALRRELAEARTYRQRRQILHDRDRAAVPPAPGLDWSLKQRSASSCSH